MTKSCQQGKDVVNEFSRGLLEAEDGIFLIAFDVELVLTEQPTETEEKFLIALGLGSLLLDIH